MKSGHFERLDQDGGSLPRNRKDMCLNEEQALGNRIRVVLVRTSHPGNIGAAARAMKTMGLSKLVLVSPKRFPDDEAVAAKMIHYLKVRKLTVEEVDSHVG